MISEIKYSNHEIKNQPKRVNQNPNFKGIETNMLNGLGWMKNNPAMAACAVDMASMVVPRTAVETKDRGIQSGIETFVREIASLLVHATIGLIGLGVSSAISGKFNKTFNTKAQNIFVSGDTIKNMSELWINSEYNKSKFFDGFLKNIKGLNTEEWKHIRAEKRSEIADNLVELAEKTNKLSNAQNNKDLKNEVKNLKSLIIAKITKETGAKSSYKLLKNNSGKEISSNLPDLIDNAVSLANAFNSQDKNKFDKFIKELIKNKKITTIIALGITSAITVSVQPINRMMTKKRTGDDGFVGVDSKKNDNSKEFKALKTFFGLGFPIFAVSTIGCKMKDLLSSVQFNGKIPSINQFKLIYGMTISSRLLASRDKNELRESLIKDTLGFCTWLLFGDFVSKLTAKAIGGKDLINNPIVKTKSQKNKFSYAKDWLMQSSVKSFDEIILPAATKISEKGKNLTFKELLKNANKETKAKISKAAFAQIVGYVFSGVVLGYGIAKLNIFITQYLHNKEKAHKQMNKETLKQDINYYNKSSVFKEFLTVK